ncbi:MAG: pyridoxamine 5'-phosphate oxidase family protein [Butyrivibrio sp.]|uniref:pyridoxamine 5'-phosphate oxidase family protein n=1 Tax=Butyrivibrio sp. TaxID=28121 RepID=UPI0025DDFC8D|nr:pyridoxamine 5'-phosphate oxidase family protein [Butyrivibrio sp.]MCR5771645.1 pyridoxamine 5'-phosphate oxidase family protein [Butyrivibrio sp.]
MFRKMRRFRQQLSDEETIAILEKGKTGILAVNGDDGYPYAVPLNYLYRDGKIIVHGAKAGHKYDAMQKSDKVSFCVIDKDEVVPDKVTNYFRSVIVFGKVRIIEDEALRKEAALAIGRKFSPEEAVQEDMNRSYANVVMYEISIEHMTGKEAIELVAMKAAQAKEKE